MQIEVSEHRLSRRVNTATQPSAEFKYSATALLDVGETLEDADRAVLTRIAETAPIDYDPWGEGLIYIPRRAIDLNPLGNGVYDAVVAYGIEGSLPAGTVSESFDTQGGSQRITHSRATIGAYAPPGKTAPYFGNAIGVTRDGVEGVDVTVPTYHFAETHTKYDADVTQAYKVTLRNLTGSVNSGLFRGFAAGEVLFIGATGQRYTSGLWNVTYHFAVQANRSNFTIGAISGIDKDGWDYLWVRFQDQVDEIAGALVKQPQAVYVEEVLPRKNFALLGIG